MLLNIDDRVLLEAEYILLNGATVRDTAKVFGVSKSTVHVDMSRRLQEINSTLYDAVRAVLEYNYSVRHIRGGDSTKRKFSGQLMSRDV